jgi:hypothetical protein
LGAAPLRGNQQPNRDTQTLSAADIAPYEGRYVTQQFTESGSLEGAVIDFGPIRPTARHEERLADPSTNPDEDSSAELGLAFYRPDDGLDLGPEANPSAPDPTSSAAQMETSLGSATMGACINGNTATGLYVVEEGVAPLYRCAGYDGVAAVVEVPRHVHQDRRSGMHPCRDVPKPFTDDRGITVIVEDPNVIAALDTGGYAATGYLNSTFVTALAAGACRVAELGSRPGSKPVVRVASLALALSRSSATR